MFVSIRVYNVSKNILVICTWKQLKCNARIHQHTLMHKTILPMQHRRSTAERISTSLSHTHLLYKTTLLLMPWMPRHNPTVTFKVFAYRHWRAQSDRHYLSESQKWAQFDLCDKLHSSPIWACNFHGAVCKTYRFFKYKNVK